MMSSPNLAGQEHFDKQTSAGGRRESPLDPRSAALDDTVAAGEGWMRRLRRGDTWRIVDLYGNQAVDTLLYNADDPLERYSAPQTIVTQRSLYLKAGTRLMSSEGRPLATIVADTCGRHDTLGGACSCESNMVRYGVDRRWMHSCRDTFLLTLATESANVGGATPVVLGKRDLVSNINFFMNVPVTESGQLTFEEGISGPGKYVELLVERDLLVLVSVCPQLNNPCNGYEPTPVRMLVWDAAP